ncbi:hypothetical protein PVAND_016545 [Polypedilum vanderplanki]|uniref:FAD synthase n=1 Tax=Polypedilum vanderplanki TaxID=319348 RepID=A0A9J6BFD9_POLVA|nr:hypothetical protein PVAND_016545 [Polypedilum vanderplanki]
MLVNIRKIIFPRNSSLYCGFKSSKVRPSSIMTATNGHQPPLTSDFDTKLKNSFDIIEKAFQQYDTRQIFLSFNGGKDCTVLLDLIKNFLKNSISDLKIFYFRQTNPFPEIDDFVSGCERHYGVKIITLEANCSMKQILEAIVENDDDLAACFMGCRKNDPTYKKREKVDPFEPTDKGWPQLMRINPLLDWTCKDIWQYLLQNKVPYCSLYNIGYTSIGNMKNTIQNPHLINDDGVTYKPAFELLDDEFERAGRL